MNREIRLGVVGLGHRGRAMFKLALSGFDGVRGVAACDLDAKLWREPQRGEPPLAESFPEIKFYDDCEQMFDEARLDALLVETPAGNHADFCIRALRRNIAVFSDIPTVATLDEAARLWDAARHSGAALMTGATTDEWGFVAALEDLYKQGFLGTPYYFEAEYIHDIRSLWPESPWRRTFPCIRYCTHSLGPLLKLLPDEELRHVSCFGSGSFIEPGPGQHDVMTAHFSTPSGKVVRFTASFINQCKCGNHAFRVFGTEGYFERLAERFGEVGRTAFSSTKLYGAQTLTRLPIDLKRPEMPGGNSGHGGADHVLFAGFFQALRDGTPMPISLRDGLRMTLPGLYAARSAERGGEVTEIRYPWDADFIRFSDL